MQRGVINIQPELVQIIQANTAEIAEHHPHTWQKLTDSANQSTELTSIELNKEEVEMILDLLPAPSATENDGLNQARSLLSELLLSLS